MTKRNSTSINPSKQINLTVMGIAYNSGGKHASRINNRTTKPYQTWRSMLNRCYSDKFHLKQPTYLDCVVCDEWLDFQAFADWMTGSDYHDTDYQLDKDIIVRGSKIYSPDTCSFIPQEINKLLNSRSSAVGVNPLGVTFKKRCKAFVAQLRVNGYKTYLGAFKCPNKAHQAYVVAREAYVKEVANEWRGRIDERVYEALMKWTVN